MQDLLQRTYDFLNTDKYKEDLLNFDVPESLKPYLGTIPKRYQVTIAARSGCGKTTFALGLAVDYIMKHPDKKVLLFSLEISKEDLMSKILAYIGNINSRKIMTKTLSEEELYYCNENIKELDTYKNFHIYDMEDVKQSVYTLAKIIDEENKEGQIDVVFLDYIQLLAPKNKDHYMLVGNCNRVLHRLAVHYNFVLFSLSQIGRDADKRADRRPMSADISGSSQIEFDSEIILILYDESHFTHEEDNPIIRKLSVECVKNRNSGFGQAYVLMNFSTGRLYNIE